MGEEIKKVDRTSTLELAWKALEKELQKPTPEAATINALRELLTFFPE